MTDVPVLDDDIAMKVRQLCYRGYQLYDAGDYQKALRAFYQAWLSLPKPQTQWREAGWALAAIGDSYFRMARYQQSCQALRTALRCPFADQSAFVHLRYGQSLYELDEASDARRQLKIAHLLGGPEAFENEPEKYWLAIEQAG